MNKISYYPYGSVPRCTDNIYMRFLLTKMVSGASCCLVLIIFENVINVLFLSHATLTTFTLRDCSFYFSWQLFYGKVFSGIYCFRWLTLRYIAQRDVVLVDCFSKYWLILFELRWSFILVVLPMWLWFLFLAFRDIYHQKMLFFPFSMHGIKLQIHSLFSATRT